MGKYVTFEIYNLEPIKASSTVMQSDCEYTKSYIPGTSIRGSFISNYIVQNDVKDLNTGIHKDRLLKDRIRFLNAYPYNGKISFPMPIGYYASKDDIKEFPEIRSIEIKRSEEDFGDKQYDSLKGIEFCIPSMDSNELKKVEVEKESNLHIAVANKNENTKIFRYEAISKGQTFWGIIYCAEDEDVKMVENILRKGTFYIGGSKGSGYGKCKINKIRTVAQNPIVKEFYDESECIESKLEDASEIYLYALSDIIYRGNSNKYESYIDEDYINDKLGLEECILEDSSSELEIVTTFNNKWGYRTPMINAIKRGSIFKYKIKGEINNEEVLRLINDGIGERRNEGYGQIMILPEMPFNKVIAASNNKKNNNKFDKNMSDDELKQLQLIVDRLYRNRLNNMFHKKVLEESSMLMPCKGRIKTNQWAKLMNLMCNMEGKKRDEGIKSLHDYFNHINEKKNNTDLKNAMGAIRVGKDTLQQHIINFVKDKGKSEFESEYVQPIKIQNVTSNISEEEIYKYKVRILKEAFNLQIKGSEK